MNIVIEQSIYMLTRKTLTLYEKIDILLNNKDNYLRYETNDL